LNEMRIERRCSNLVQVIERFLLFQWDNNIVNM